MTEGGQASRSDGHLLVVDKIGLVLDAFLEASGELSLAQIARRTRLAKSTTHRLLTSLARIGLVEQHAPTGGYRLGMRLLALGSAVSRQLDVRTVASPVLHDLWKGTRQTVYLTLPRGDEAVCIERLAGARVTIEGLQLGGALPLYAGAAPRVFLAALPHDRLEAYLVRAPFPALTAATLVGADALRRDAALTRERGYVLSAADVTPGVWALGAPVFDAQRAVVAAVSISDIAAAYQGERLGALVGAVLAASARISRGLGATATTFASDVASAG